MARQPITKKRGMPTSRLTSNTTFKAWTRSRLQYLKSINQDAILILTNGTQVSGVIQDVGADMVNIAPTPGGNPNVITLAIPFSAIAIFEATF
jgi:hypothetical protein